MLHGKPIIVTGAAAEDGVAEDGTILIAADAADKGKANATCPVAHVKSEEMGGCPFSGLANLSNGNAAH